MRTAVLCILVGLFPVVSAAVEPSDFHFPLIAKYGGVVHLPRAAEQPRKGARIDFDITAESKPQEVNRGLESVARYLNLNAQAGNATAEVKLALVMHGAATRCALTDGAYAKQTDLAKNPNLELLRELKTHGVELYVCGQSLARNKLSAADAASEVRVAVSAMTVNVNKQQDGFSYLAVH